MLVWVNLLISFGHVFSLISADLNGVLPFGRAILLQQGSLELEGLLVRKTVKESVGSGSLEAISDISILCSSLQLCVALIRVGLNRVVVLIVFFLATDLCLVLLLEGLVVLWESFDELLTFLFFFFFATSENSLDNSPEKDQEEDKNGS